MHSFESGYYPAGAEHDPNAPWNQVDPPEEEVEVTISITLSRTVKVTVTDYTVEDEGVEDGVHYRDIDYYSCDLKQAVKEQYPQYCPEAFEGWTEDDFEVAL